MAFLSPMVTSPMAPMMTNQIGPMVTSPMAPMMTNQVGPMMTNPYVSPLMTRPAVAPFTQVNPNPMSPAQLVRQVSANSPDIPFIPTIDFTYSRPAIAMVENMNTDPTLHNKMTKYFYYKTLDKWLYGELVDVLSYFKASKDGVSLISSLDSYHKDASLKESQDTINKKIDYLEDKLFTKKMVFRILDTFVRESGTNWYDLTNVEGAVREVIKKAVVKRVKKAVVKKSFKK